jgi:hypothetical protein
MQPKKKIGKRAREIAVQESRAQVNSGKRHKDPPQPVGNVSAPKRKTFLSVKHFLAAKNKPL